MTLPTALFFISCFILCTLSVLIFENRRITREKRRIFIFTYAVILTAGFAEWAALALNGASAEYFALHAAVKSLDYMLTPTAGVFFVLQICERPPLKRLIYSLLSANAILHLISIFTGWTFYLDSANYYHHGPFYYVYIVLYCFIIAYVVWQFFAYGRSFPQHNRASITLIGIFVAGGVLVQNIDSNLRIVTLNLSVGSALLFIHYIEFVLQKNDMDLNEKERLLEHDIMTGCLSRYAFSKHCAEYRAGLSSVENLCVVSLDLNGLKAANDNFGHMAGDELICAAAQLILNSFGSYGNCYRTGGDEFICLLNTDRQELSSQLAKLNIGCESWHGNLTDKLSIAAGYCISSEYPELGIDELIRESDKMMYRVKSEFYRISGNDRRRREY